LNRASNGSSLLGVVRRLEQWIVRVMRKVEHLNVRLRRWGVLRDWLRLKNEGVVVKRWRWSWGDSVVLEVYVLWSVDMTCTVIGLDRRRCHAVVQLVVDHVIREGLSLRLRSSFASVLCLLDLVRHLDHQICIFQMWVLGSDFGHGFVGCFLDLLLVAIFHVLVQRAAAGRNFAKVLVCCHVLRADITRMLLASKPRIWSTRKHTIAH
jgi:hypothetical protein